MPIYEYQCDGCHHKFEILQKISDALLKTCPECSEERLRKLVSAAAFRLKGTGWYETDFKDKKPKHKSDKTEDKTAKDGKVSGDKPKSTDSKESKTTATGSGNSNSSTKPGTTTSSD